LLVWRVAGLVEAVEEDVIVEMMGSLESVVHLLVFHAYLWRVNGLVEVEELHD